MNKKPDRELMETDRRKNRRANGQKGKTIDKGMTDEAKTRTRRRADGKEIEEKGDDADGKLTGERMWTSGERRQRNEKQTHEVETRTGRRAHRK